MIFNNTITETTIDAEDGVRWKKKTVRWTFFPSNRPTKALCAEETEPTEFCLLPHEKKHPRQYA